MKFEKKYLLVLAAFLAPILGFLGGRLVPPPWPFLPPILLGLFLAVVITKFLFDLERKEVDLDKQKRASEVMIQREHEIINKIGDIVFTLDLDGNITAMNQKAEKIFGRSVGEILGKSITTLLAPKSVEIFTAKINELGDIDYVSPFEVELNTIYGKKTYELCLGSITKDGLPFKIHSIGWDITKRKMIEQKLKEKVLEIEKLTKRTLDREMRIVELEKEVGKHKGN